jgi:predicted TIM-barrel fold metal-dependent hydrolase
MTVIVPHFGVTFFTPGDASWRDFERMIDTYPNLYTDTSFGTRAILISGLEAVNQNPDTFRAFIKKYSDRVLFGTDMVITGNREKSVEWIADVIRACRSMLETKAYAYAIGAQGSPYASKEANNVHGTFRGLALDDETLKKIYETNFDRLFAPR